MPRTPSSQRQPHSSSASSRHESASRSHAHSQRKTSFPHPGGGGLAAQLRMHPHRSPGSTTPRSGSDRRSRLHRAHTYTSATSPRSPVSDHDVAHSQLGRSARTPEHTPNVSSSRVSNYATGESPSRSHSQSKSPMVLGSLKQQLMLEKARKQQLANVSQTSRPSTSPRLRSRPSSSHRSSSIRDLFHSSVHGRDLGHADGGSTTGAIDMPASSSRSRHRRRDNDDDDFALFSVGSIGSPGVDSNYFGQHRHGNRRIPRSVPVHRTVPQRVRVYFYFVFFILIFLTLVFGAGFFLERSPLTRIGFIGARGSPINFVELRQQWRTCGSGNSVVRLVWFDRTPSSSP